MDKIAEELEFIIQKLSSIEEMYEETMIECINDEKNRIYMSGVTSGLSKARYMMEDRLEYLKGTITNN